MRDWDESSIDSDPFFYGLGEYNPTPEQEERNRKRREEEKSLEEEGPLRDKFIKDCTNIPIYDRNFYGRDIYVEDKGSLSFSLYRKDLAYLFNKLGKIKYEYSDCHKPPTMTDLIEGSKRWDHLMDRYPEIGEYRELSSRIYDETREWFSQSKLYILIERDGKLLEAFTKNIYKDISIWKDVKIRFLDYERLEMGEIYQKGDVRLFGREIHDMVYLSKPLVKVVEVPRTQFKTPKYNGDVWLDIPHLTFEKIR